MDEREQQRKVRHRLAVLRHAEEVTGNVAATCRYYGISRQCVYKWKHRYDELGEAGLRDGSSAPLHSPNQTKAEVVGKIVYLRRTTTSARTRSRPERSVMRTTGTPSPTWSPVTAAATTSGTASPWLRAKHRASVSRRGASGSASR